MEHVDPRPEQMNANATHMPILAAVLAKTKGPILELGTGHFSTQLFHFMAKINGRLAVSVDTYRDWSEYFSKQFSEENHKHVCTDNQLISTAFFGDEAWGNFNWDVAFVDHAPEIDRKKCIELLRENAKYIVVHDAEPLATCYGWGDIFETFPNRFYYDFYGNGTMVVSMTEDCSWL